MSIAKLTGRKPGSGENGGQSVSSEIMQTITIKRD
jgi:hypothetical protein